MAEQKTTSAWLHTAVAGIRFKPDRAAVEAELREHIEDKTLDLMRIFPDMTAEEAEDRALSQMGDPEEIGKELAKIHKPWLGYLWRASRALAVLACLWLVSFGLLRGDDAYLGDDPRSEWWDFDGLPGTAVMGEDDDVRYLPGEDPDQLLALEPGLTETVEGQKVSLLRAALWREEDGRLALYCYLRVETWRFWERGRLRDQWMTVTDSVGNVYGLGINSPEDPASGGLLNGLQQGGFGPFHSGYELSLRGLAPAAEWVRLDYGPGEPVFSFTVQIEEETA